MKTGESRPARGFRQQRTFAAFALPVNKAIFLCCAEKVNLGLDNNTWGGGFSNAVREKSRKSIAMPCGDPGRRGLRGSRGTGPICNAYKSMPAIPNFYAAGHVVVIGTGPLGLFSVQMARIMGRKYRGGWHG